jgi:hypothetical protein
VPVSLHLAGAMLGQDVRMHEVTAGFAILSQCTISGTAVMENGVYGSPEQPGGLAIVGSTVAGGVQVHGAAVHGALNLDQTQVAQALEISSNVRVVGVVSAVRLSVGRSLILDGLKIEPPSTGTGSGAEPAAEESGEASPPALPARQGLSLSGATVGEHLIVSDTTCWGAAWLGSARITQRVRIVDSSFGALGTWSLVVDDAGIGSDLFLSGGRFGGGISFDGASVGGDLAIERTTIDVEDPVIGLAARKATVRGALTLSELSTRGRVDLSNLAVERIDDLPALWDGFGSYVLNGLDVSQVDSEAWPVKKRIDWLVQSTRSGSPAPFERYAQRLEGAARPNDALKVRIAAEHHAARALRRVFLRPIGYGYRPELAVIPFVVAFVVLLSVVVWGRNTDRFVATDAPAEMIVRSSECNERQYPCLAPVGYALDVLVPVVDFDEQSAWRPATRPLRVALWLMTAIGWLFTTLVVVGITSRIRKT